MQRPWSMQTTSPGAFPGVLRVASCHRQERSSCSWFCRFADEPRPARPQIPTSCIPISCCIAARRLILLDAFAVLYRAHFSFGPTMRLVTSAGEDTSVLYGALTSPAASIPIMMSAEMVALEGSVLQARRRFWVCARRGTEPAVTRARTSTAGERRFHPMLADSRRLPERPAGAAGGATAAQPPGRGAGRGRLGLGRQKLQAGQLGPTMCPSAATLTLLQTAHGRAAIACGRATA